MMARGREKVSAMGGVEVEEYARNANSFFLEELLEEGLKSKHTDHVLGALKKLT